MKTVTARRGIFQRSLGFTQIELLLSMGILMILISVLTTLFGQILDVQLESKSISSVDQNGRYILSRLTRDMQSASTIVKPATPGQTTDTLQIRINSINYSYTATPGGNLILTNNTGSNALNNNSANISAVTFTRIGNGDSNDTIRVGFTITSRMQQGTRNEQKSFQTTLGLQ